MAIRQLPQAVQTALRNGVIVTSPAHAVVELVLNSLDAGATSVAVRVDLKVLKIQVIDNGCGMGLEQLDALGPRYMTSKCHTLEDLCSNVVQYGFRGEAVASLISVSGIFLIISRPSGSKETYCKAFTHGNAKEGVISNTERPASGTTITVQDFMCNMPVRRKRISEAIDLEEIRSHIECIALIHPEVSFSLRNDAKHSMILHKHKSADLLDSFRHLFGQVVTQSLAPLNYTSEKFNISGFIGKEPHNQKNLQFIYVNKRVIVKTKLHHLVNALLGKSAILRANGPWRHKPVPKGASTDWLFAFAPPEKRRKFAVFVLHIECASKEYDVYLDPRKTLIEFEDWQGILNCVQESIRIFLEKECLAYSEEVNNSSSQESNSCQIDHTEDRKNKVENDKIVNKGDGKSSLVKSVNNRNCDTEQCLNKAGTVIPRAVYGLPAKRTDRKIGNRNLKSKTKHKISRKLHMGDNSDTGVPSVYSTDDQSEGLANTLAMSHDDVTMNDSDSVPYTESLDTNTVSSSKEEYIIDRPIVKFKHKYQRPRVSKLKILKSAYLFKLDQMNQQINKDVSKTLQNYKCEALLSKGISRHDCEPHADKLGVLKAGIDNRLAIVDNVSVIGSNLASQKFNRLECPREFIKSRVTCIGEERNSNSQPIAQQTKYDLIMNCIFQERKEKESYISLPPYILSNETNTKSPYFLRGKESTRKGLGVDSSLIENRFIHTNSCNEIQNDFEQLRKACPKLALGKEFPRGVCLETPIEQLTSSQPKLLYSQACNETINEIELDCVKNVEVLTSISEDCHVLRKQSCGNYFEHKTNIRPEHSDTQSELCDVLKGAVISKPYYKTEEEKCFSKSIPYKLQPNIINIRKRSKILNTPTFQVNKIRSTVDEKHVYCSNAVTLPNTGSNLSSFTDFDIESGLSTYRKIVPRSDSNDSITVNKTHNSGILKSKSVEIKNTHPSINLSVSEMKFISIPSCCSPYFGTSKLIQNKLNLGNLKSWKLNTGESEQVGITLNATDSLHMNNSLAQNSDNIIECTPEMVLIDSTIGDRENEHLNFTPVLNSDFNQHISHLLGPKESPYFSSKQISHIGAHSMHTTRKRNPDRDLNMYGKRASLENDIDKTHIILDKDSEPVSSFVSSQECLNDKSVSTITATTNGVQEPAIETNEDFTKASQVTEDSQKKSRIQEEWIQKLDHNGRIFYIHIHSGMTSYNAPVTTEEQNLFTITKRYGFLPKGMSPLLNESMPEGLKAGPSLTPESREALHTAILNDSTEDELATVKWKDASGLKKTGNKDLLKELLSSAENRMQYCEKPVPSISFAGTSKLAVKMSGIINSYKFNKDIFSNIQIVKQWDGKFIVTLVSLETGKRPHVIGVFDQHAVHERIRLEALMKEYLVDTKHSYFKSSDTSPHITLDLCGKEVRILSSFKDDFERIGLTFEILNNVSIKVTKVPTCLHTRELRERSRGTSVLKNLLQILIQSHVEFLLKTRGTGPTVPEILQEVINYEACRGAIKFGDLLTNEDCKALMVSLSQCEVPFYCAHGRPSFIPIFDLTQFEMQKKHGWN